MGERTPNIKFKNFKIKKSRSVCCVEGSTGEKHFNKIIKKDDRSCIFT